MRSERVIRIAVTAYTLILLLLATQVDQIAATPLPSSPSSLPRHYVGGSSPQVHLFPLSGSVGDLITIYGSGFTPNQYMTFMADGVAIFVYQTGWDGRMQVITDFSGAFGNSAATGRTALQPSVVFPIPTLIEGSHTIAAQDEAGNIEQATLTVVPKIMVSPLEGTVGANVRVYGTSMKPEIPITITMDSLPSREWGATTDKGGFFNTFIEVPDTHKGIYTINVNEGDVNKEFSFIVEGEPPPAPNLLLPKASSVTKQPIRFTWETVSDPSGVTYELQVSADPEFGKLLLDEKNLTSLEYVMTEAEKISLSINGRVFNWRVRATDGIGQGGAWASPFTFTISHPWPAWVVYLCYGLGIMVIIIIGLWIRRRINNTHYRHPKES